MLTNGLDDRQFEELTGGGECHLHHHPIDQVFTHYQLDQLQSCEVIKNISADYTALPTEDIIVADSTSGNVTVTLPLSKGNKEFIIVKSVAANTVRIQFSGSDTLFGLSFVTLTAASSCIRVKGIVGGYIPLENFSSASGTAGANPYYVTSTGTGTAYVLTLPVGSVYTTLTAGDTFTWQTNVISGASPTLAVNGTTAKQLIDLNGVNLLAGALPNGAVVTVVYNGTAWQVINSTLPPGRDPLFVTSTGTGLAYIVTLPTGSVYTTLTAGDTFNWKTHTISSAAATLSINGTTAKQLVDINEANLLAGALPAGSVITVIYTGTAWRVVDSTLPPGRNKFYLTSGGTSSAYTLTLPAGSVYTNLVQGDTFTWVAHTTNAAMPTLKVGGSLAEQLVDISDMDLVAGAIPSGTVVTVVFNGVNWRVTSLGTAATIPLSTDVSNIISKTQSTALTETMLFDSTSLVTSAIKLLQTDNFSPAVGTAFPFIGGFYSKRTVTLGSNASTARDAGKPSTGHLGLVHDVLCTDNAGDLAAVLHVVKMAGSNANNRADTACLEYFHDINTVGTAYSSILEGTQFVTATGAANASGATTMVGLACHINVADSAPYTNVGSYYYLLGSNDSNTFACSSFMLMRGKWNNIFVGGPATIVGCGLDLYTNMTWTANAQAIQMSKQTILDFRGENAGNYYIRANSSADTLDIVAGGTFVQHLSNDLVDFPANVQLEAGKTLLLQGTSSLPKKLIDVGTNGNLRFLANDLSTVLASIGEVSGVPSFNLPGSSSTITINSQSVVKGRVTGYTAMTGTIDRASTFDPSTVTLAQIAQRVNALQTDLTAHGLIGA